MLNIVSKDDTVYNRYKKDSKRTIKKFGDGTTMVFAGEHTYIFWNRVTIVLPHIYQFLKLRYPNSIILPEFNHIDFVILDENIPVEVQSTVINRGFVSHSYFEQMIEKQIRANIERYGKCWFFFDSEYLRYMQDGVSRGIRIDMKWFLEYMQDGLLNVFVVSHHGKIDDITHNIFVTDHSGKIDSIVHNDLKFVIDHIHNIDINKNEATILYQKLLQYGYTNSEIRNFANEKRMSLDKCAMSKWLTKKEHSYRKKMLGNILMSI